MYSRPYPITVSCGFTSMCPKPAISNTGPARVRIKILAIRTGGLKLNSCWRTAREFTRDAGNTVTVESNFNPETGNISFRADFSNPDLLLRHGQTGTVLIRRKVKNAIVIPQRATSRFSTGGTFMSSARMTSCASVTLAFRTSWMTSSSSRKGSM